MQCGRRAKTGIRYRYSCGFPCVCVCAVCKLDGLGNVVGRIVFYVYGVYTVVKVCNLKCDLLGTLRNYTAVYGKIRELTNHDATLIEGQGCYEGADRHILYSVVGREQVDKVIGAIKEIDPHAFINVINTEQINGRFYRTPTK